MTLINGSFKTLKSHNNTNKLTNRDGGRPAAPVFRDVKIMLLSKESGGFGESTDGYSGFSVLSERLSDSKI